MTPGLRRGIAFGLIAELPGVVALAMAAPALAVHGPLLAVVGGFGLLMIGTLVGLGALATVDAVLE